MSLLAIPVADWSDTCAAIIINNSVSTGLVDQFGNPMPAFTNLTWGITRSTCYQYCGKDKIYQAFDFNNFATDFTSWLLPWLALTAQLPFQAKGPKGNLMSLFMAVGSPALITYSLTITILNRNWVRREFESLLKGLNKDLREKIGERLEAAQYLLQESQQVPMRASQVGGWLSSLIVLDKNEAWWTRVKKDLQKSRRGYTFSLVAQIGLAFIAYTFTIAITLNSSPLGTSEGSNIELTAGGGLWIWMIPVIWGWIMCGTQARACSIEEALNDETHHAFRIDRRGKVLKDETQYGIRSGTGLIPRPRSLELQKETSSPRRTSVTTEETGRGTFDEIELNSEPSKGAERVIIEGTRGFDHCSRNENSGAADDRRDKSELRIISTAMVRTQFLGDFSDENFEMLKLPSWLGLSIEGDEALEGPIFNYARLFTFRKFSSTIIKAFRASNSSLKAGNSQGEDIFEVAEACKLCEIPLEAYTPWDETDPALWHHILIAAAAAIFVQWGTTGPAIMMAYLTPTVGLGCRSGSYLIYGVGASISWALLVCSFLLSHAANLRYQDIYMNRSPFSPRKDRKDRKHNKDIENFPESVGVPLMDQFTSLDSDPINLSLHQRTWSHSALVLLAVTTRAAGKVLATVNACWIVVSSIFEYTGVYSQCWCDTNSDVMGSRGWAVLFATDDSFRAVARNYWVGGVLFSFGVCFFAWVGFRLGCGKSDVDEYEG